MTDDVVDLVVGGCPDCDDWGACPDHTVVTPGYAAGVIAVLVLIVAAMCVAAGALPLGAW